MTTPPPYQRHSDTSRGAAFAVSAAAASIRAKVLAWFRENGPATDEQMLDGLSLAPSTGRPRRVELVQGGWLEDSGERGRTRAKKRAVRWRCTGKKPERERATARQRELFPGEAPA